MKRILFCIILIVCSITIYGNNFIREYCADDEYNIEKVLSQDNEKYICLSSKYDIGDFTIKWKGYRIWCYDTITKSVLWEYPLIGEFPGYYGRINADINWYKDNIVISWFTENADSLYQHYFIVGTDGEIKKSTVHFSYKINYGNLGSLDWHVVDCHDDYSAILLESYAWGAVYITRVVQDSIVDKFTLYKNNDVQNDMDKVFSVFNKFSTKINDNILLSSNHQLGLLDYSIILRKDMNSVTDIDGGDSILTHIYLYQKFPKFSILDSFIIKFPSELSIDNYFKFLDKNYLQIVSESHNQENFQTDYSCIHIYNIENKILKKVSEQNFAIPIDIGFDVNHKYISSYCNLFPMYVHDTLKVVRYEDDKIVEVFKLDTFLTTYRSHNLYGGYKLFSMDGLDKNNINRRFMYVLDSNYKVKWHKEENNKYTYKNIIPDKDKNIFWILNNTFEGLEIMKFDIFQLKKDTYNISRASFWQVDYHIPEIQNRIIFNSEKSNIVTECSSEILVWDNNSTLIKDHNFEEGFLNVYPNPSKDILYFDNEIDKIDQILLSDMQGRTSSMTITSNKLDLYSFPAGMYILHLVYKNGNMANAKFVKQ